MVTKASFGAAAPTRPQASSADIVSFVGRLLMSAIFLLSGLSKLSDPAGTLGYIQSAGLPFPTLGLGVAVAVEIGGSLLLIAGFRTRWVAGALALFSLAAALAFHHDFADQNQFIHFLKNVAMAGGLLQLVAHGGGRLTLDRR
jgi:putative oxidoreductase